MGEGARGSGTKKVNVGSDEPTPGALFPQDQQRHIPQLRIQGAQEFGKLEICEPAGEALSDGVAPGSSGKGEARRSPQAVNRVAQRSVGLDLRAQCAGVWRIGEDRRANRIEQLARGRDVAALGDQDPANVG